VTNLNCKLTAVERHAGKDVRRVTIDGTEWFVAGDLVAATLPNDSLVEMLKAYDSPVQWRGEKLVPRNALADIGATNDAAAALCLYLEQQVQLAAMYAQTRRTAA
jgi:hypothetical protein